MKKFQDLKKVYGGDAASTAVDTIVAIVAENAVKEAAHQFPVWCWSIGEGMNQEFTDDPIIIDDYLKMYEEVCEANEDFYPVGKPAWRE